jgi:hypothetical protein
MGGVFERDLVLSRSRELGEHEKAATDPIA